MSVDPSLLELFHTAKRAVQAVAEHTGSEVGERQQMLTDLQEYAVKLENDLESDDDDSDLDDDIDDDEDLEDDEDETDY